MNLIHTTQQGIEICWEAGKKKESSLDFIIRYKGPFGKLRTPKHIHWTVDLLIKMQHQKRLTKSFIDHLLNMLDALQPLTAFPPELQFFRPEHVERFLKLDEYGDYSVEFLLVVIELIMLQELTNYPNGNVNRRLLEAIREGKDIFTIVARATQVRQGT